MTEANFQNDTFPSPAEWARNELALPAGATPDEIKRVWLVHLAGSGMLPAQDTFESFATLLPELDAPDETPPAYLAARRDAAAEEVALLARDFLKLDAHTRSRRLFELRSRVPLHGRASAQLEWLAVGEKVEVPAFIISSEQESLPICEQQRTVESLARDIIHCFVQSPQQRAARERVLVADDVQWQRAARDLQRQHASIAALAPTLVDKLAHAKRRRRQHRRRVLILKHDGYIEKTARDKLWDWSAVVVFALIIISITVAWYRYNGLEPLRPFGSQWKGLAHYLSDDNQVSSRILNPTERTTRADELARLNETWRRRYDQLRTRWEQLAQKQRYQELKNWLAASQNAEYAAEDDLQTWLDGLRRFNEKHPRQDDDFVSDLQATLNASSELQVRMELAVARFEHFWISRWNEKPVGGWPATTVPSEEFIVLEDYVGQYLRLTATGEAFYLDSLTSAVQDVSGQP